MPVMPMSQASITRCSISCVSTGRPDMSDYIISDEPTPGLQQRFVVNPMLPLFYFMFGTTLVAWGWLAFNAYAMGSGKRVREWGILAFGAVMSVIITLGIFFLVTADVFPDI